MRRWLVGERGFPDRWRARNHHAIPTNIIHHSIPVFKNEQIKKRRREWVTLFWEENKVHCLFRWVGITPVSAERKKEGKTNQFLSEPPPPSTAAAGAGRNKKKTCFTLKKKRSKKKNNRRRIKGVARFLYFFFFFNCQFLGSWSNNLGKGAKH